MNVCPAWFASCFGLNIPCCSDISPFGMRMCTLSQDYVLEGVFLVLQGLPYFTGSLHWISGEKPYLAFWTTGAMLSLLRWISCILYSPMDENLLHTGLEYCVLVWNVPTGSYIKCSVSNVGIFIEMSICVLIISWRFWLQWGINQLMATSGRHDWEVVKTSIWLHWRRCITVMVGLSLRVVSCPRTLSVVEWAPSPCNTCLPWCTASPQTETRDPDACCLQTITS